MWFFFVVNFAYNVWLWYKDGSHISGKYDIKMVYFLSLGCTSLPKSYSSSPSPELYPDVHRFRFVSFSIWCWPAWLSWLLIGRQAKHSGSGCSKQGVRGARLRFLERQLMEKFADSSCHFSRTSNNLAGYEGRFEVVSCVLVSWDVHWAVIWDLILWSVWFFQSL